MPVSLLATSVYFFPIVWSLPGRGRLGVALAGAVAAAD